MAGAPTIPTAADLRLLAKVAVTRARLRLCALTGRPPVVTYATYRTASSSTHWAIRRALGTRAIKAHALYPGRLGRRESLDLHAVDGAAVPVSRHAGDWAVSREIVLPCRAARFVILVRDPVAVAASHYSVFSSGRSWLPEGLATFDWPADGAAEPGTLARLAAGMFDGAFHWRLMDRWFDEDVQPALGWDALAQPFDREAGHAQHRHGPWDILLMRADLPDAAKSDVLSRFLGVPGIEVRRENRSEDLGRSGLSAAVRRAIRLRPDAVRTLLDGRMARHFWTDAQRDAMLAKWLG
jgi:hypothetical protein